MQQRSGVTTGHAPIRCRPLPIDAALPRLTAALARATMPPCWSRRPAPARPRACRWCCPTSRGRRTRKILVLEPRRLAARAAAARMAETLGERSARRSAIACASARRCRAHPHRSRHRGHFHRMILDDPVARRRRRGAVRRVPRALARRRSRPRARARRAAGSARGPQAAGDVGDARRRARGETAGRRAGDRKRGPRLSGRDALSRPRSARADRARRSPTR